LVSGLCGYLGIVRQHTGVIEQFLSIDGRFGDVLEAQKEELQDMAMVGSEQFPQRTHDASRSHVIGRGGPQAQPPERQPRRSAAIV